MKKCKKVLLTIAIILVIALAITLTVFYIIDKNGTQAVLDNIWNGLNRPLPIIGLSTLVIAITIFKIVVGIRFGKNKIAQIEQTYQEKVNELMKMNNDLIDFKNDIVDRVKKGEECIVETCKVIPNVKVNAIGQKFEKGLDYGTQEETTNNNPKEE